MGATIRLGVMDGDGIGPEITRATRLAMEAAARRHPEVVIDWAPLPMGWEAIRAVGVALPDATKAALAECDGWIMGPHDSASYPPAEQTRRNPSGELRKHFDLFANIRPARAIPGVPCLAPTADLVIVRENTEEFYPDRNLFMGQGEWMPTPDVALSLGVFTRPAAERIARVAAELALTRRRHLTIVHKANVIKLGFGLFRDVCRQVAAEYPSLVVDDQHVDAMTAHLVRHAGDYDVIVATNMFGDILSDLTGELTGSLGMAAALNAGARYAMAQAAHGSAPDIAGQDRANPTALLRSAALLCGWLADRRGLPSLAAMGAELDAAVTATLASGCRTADLGGDAGTRAFTDAVLAWLAS